MTAQLRPELAGAVDMAFEAFASENLNSSETCVDRCVGARSLLLDLADVLRVVGVKVSTGAFDRSRLNDHTQEEVTLTTWVERPGPYKRVIVATAGGGFTLKVLSASNESAAPAPDLIWHPQLRCFVGPRVRRGGRVVREWGVMGAPFVRREPVELLLAWVLPHLVASS